MAAINTVASCHVEQQLQHDTTDTQQLLQHVHNEQQHCYVAQVSPLLSVRATTHRAHSPPPPPVTFPPLNSYLNPHVIPTLHPPQDLAHSAQPSTHSTLTGTDIAAREAAVARREAALAAKEKDVAAREAQLRREGKGPKKNWPLCFPIVHHDIANDVPPAMRGIVRQVYMCFLVSRGPL